MRMSIDALVALDPQSLSGRERLHALVGFAAARARLDAAEAAMIFAVDQGCDFLEDGATSTRAWLAAHTHVARPVAGSRVHLAKRLARMPAMAAALAEGAVTLEHARVLARCINPRTVGVFVTGEEALVTAARSLDVEGFEAVAAQWLRDNDPDGPDPATGEPSTWSASRHFGGRVSVDGDMDADDGAEYLAELDALYEELWREDQAADAGDPARGRTPRQRRAAAQVEMARRSSATRRQDTEDEEAEAAGEPVPTRTRPRTRTLLAVVDLNQLAAQQGQLARLEDGSILPRSILERWACDTAIGRVVMAGKSVVIDLGTVTYTPNAAQRRALIARDGGCIVPGCGRRPRWCDAHHVIPFPHGPTALWNLVLLCNRHHHLIHDGHIRLAADGAGGWRVLRADGTPVVVREGATAA
jgi:hypothetical protein